MTRTNVYIAFFLFVHLVLSTLRSPVIRIAFVFAFVVGLVYCLVTAVVGFWGVRPVLRRNGNIITQII